METSSMEVNIIVPALGESIAEATIAKWHKKEGDNVQADELLVELETEKVTLEVNSPAAGTLSKIIKPQGQTVLVGENIGQVSKNTALTHVSPPPIAAASPPPQNIATSVVLPSTNSPSVEKLLKENNLATSSLTGTGRDGRLTKADVLSTIANNVPSTANSTNNDTRSTTRIKMSRLRKTIAQRLKDSQNTAAILTSFNEIDMSNVVALRQNYREEFEKKHNIKLGFMSFFVKAVVRALQLIPAINAEIDGDDIVYKNYYDIGVAVGTEQGLVVPVVRNCAQLNLADIEREIALLSKKAREGKLSMADLSNGTFSITNGGVYGSLLSTPIINPPQSGILGLHKIEDRPIAVNNKVEIRPMMYVALSYDHRIIDGKEAVTFLVKIKEAIEAPERLLLNL